jgi:Cu/Ag efflux protein CusF
MKKHMLRNMVVAASVAGLALAFLPSGRAQEKTTGNSAEKAKRHELFTGTVESIDTTAGTVTVKGTSETKTFKTDAKTELSSKDKKMAALSDLKAGEKVTVHYSEMGGTLSAHRIAPAREMKQPATPQK